VSPRGAGVPGGGDPSAAIICTQPPMLDKTRTDPHPEALRRLADGAARTCLVFIEGARLGDLLLLDDESIVLGRDESCEVRVPGAGVSRRHCRIARDGEVWVLQDLGSTNGTWLNDEPVNLAALRDGDIIGVGDSLLKFVTERNVEARYYSELHEKLARDSLTGLSNKESFERVIEVEVQRARRYGRTLSLILMDLDHFKQVNDRHGHLAGDAVLRQLGETLRTRVRRGDNLFRVGGEELALILPETAIAIASVVAESYRQLVETTDFSAGAETIRLTLSAGVAEWNGELAAATALIGLADRRLYRAKEAGRNRVEPRAATDS
jgi:diguanylate cyclase (GGDEF)-like protein